MQAIDGLLAELDERTIAQRIAVMHDEARMRYPLGSNTVSTYQQFKNIITDYYNYHHTNCVSHGGQLLASEAYGKAKELLERQYRKQNGDIVSAFNNGRDGTNGGMRVVLDMIADGLKAEVIERYITDVFDRYIEPNSWEQKVEIICQFISYCGNMLSSSVVAAQPERYAHDYSGLIKSYIDGLQRTSSMFRRL